ncbi:E3 ubiquitin-protein ligase ATL6-like [Tasmannia lanceolata]|uniref:E3 ubiquitin-protein ligase ATL6-like n=1 Tax=Tasmannia lanceolata TaxID=3420 RepID=UPI0040630E84
MIHLTITKQWRRSLSLCKGEQKMKEDWETMAIQMRTEKRINHSRPILHLHFFIYLLLASLALAQPNDTPPSQYGFNTRFSPSMAIIIVVLIAAFFFMGFFSIYLRQCTGESLRGTAPAINVGARSRRGARGLDQAIINTFPTFNYSVVKGLKLGKGTLECAVCLSEFSDEETLRLLPKCSHVFHPDCIDTWLASHTTCPVCRSNLVPGSDSDPTPGAPADDDNGTENEVAIRVEDDRDQDLQPEVIDPTQIPIQNRPPRSGSSRRPWFAGRFPRSHSTGHSLVQPGENVERFTLRLPEHIRREIVKGKLNRTISCVTFPIEGVSEGSVRRGSYKSGGEGSSRGRSVGWLDRRSKSDRWGLSMAQGFLSRTFSFNSAKRSADGEQTVTATTPKLSFPSVKTPFDCLGAKAEADEQLSVRESAPVFTVSHQPDV